jgi:uncharacterized protein YndB with AHSA1/START domain
MTDSTASTHSVVIGRTFDAGIDLVWQMWTAEEHFATWYGPTGGKRLVCMEMETPNGPMQMWFTDEYREIVPNERLVYTESMSDPEGNILSPADMGMPEGHPETTEIIVELSPADSPGAAGWNMALDKMAAHVATQAG